MTSPLRSWPTHFIRKPRSSSRLKRCPLLSLACAAILRHDCAMTAVSRSALFCAIALCVLMLSTPMRAENVPYEKQLLRLSEILGSVHYLRNLCGEKDGGWRDQMETLLEAENPEPARRARMVASFNRGYRTFGSIYKTCTESATEAIARYMKEGEALTKEVVVRYGN